MSCNTICYLPRPARDWSRVQNSCSLITDYQPNATVKLPFSGKIVPASTVYLEYAMLNKGNILQYKKNSSQLTQKQKYSKIAQGKWVNRNTTWATQSTRGYTNPNTQSLLRVGSVNVTLEGVPTTQPVTCPTSNNSQTQPIVIQDLGNLVCGTYQNICTGETISQPTDQLCHPTTDSDVPGAIMELCWNNGTPTWFPRQRYIMTNSGNKWPTNATLLSAVKPYPPVITSYTTVNNKTTLTWTQDERCIVVTQFTIYENNLPIQIVAGNIFTKELTVENGSVIYIIGKNGDVYSDPSNSVIPIPTTVSK